jgi:hypothetical protein
VAVAGRFHELALHAAVGEGLNERAVAAEKRVVRAAGDSEEFRRGLSQGRIGPKIVAIFGRKLDIKKAVCRGRDLAALGGFSLWDPTPGTGTRYGMQEVLAYAGWRADPVPVERIGGALDRPITRRFVATSPTCPAGRIE